MAAVIAGQEFQDRAILAMGAGGQNDRIIRPFHRYSFG
jgi:hypothetical protein